MADSVAVDYRRNPRTSPLAPTPSVHSEAISVEGNRVGAWSARSQEFAGLVGQTIDRNRRQVRQLQRAEPTFCKPPKVVHELLILVLIVDEAADVGEVEV